MKISFSGNGIMITLEERPTSDVTFLYFSLFARYTRFMYKSTRIHFSTIYTYVQKHSHIS